MVEAKATPASHNLLLLVEMLLCWQNPLLLADLRELLAEKSATELFWRLTSVAGREEEVNERSMPAPKLLQPRNMPVIKPTQNHAKVRIVLISNIHRLG